MTSTNFQNFHSVVNFLLLHLSLQPQMQTNPPLEILSSIPGKHLPTLEWFIKVDYQQAQGTSMKNSYIDF